MVKENKCGTSTLILKKDNVYYAKIMRCNKWTCKTCSEKKKQAFLRDVIKYQNKYNMNNMLTLTTSIDINDLNNKFKKMVYVLKEYEKHRYMSKNKGKSIYSFEESIAQKIKDEAFLIWLYEGKIECNGKEYVPRVHYSIKIFEALKNRTLNEWIENSRDLMKYYKIFDEKYSSFERYIDLRSRKEKLAHQYYFDFKNVFITIYDKLNDKNIFLESAKDRINQITSYDENVKYFHYIKVLEYTKRNQAHYHILTNLYIPYIILERVQSNDSFSFDQVDYKDTIGENKTNILAKYLAKYVTKDIDEENDNNSIEVGRKVTHSLSIQMDFDKKEKSDFKYIDSVPGVMNEEFVQIKEDLSSFKRKLLQQSEFKNSDLYEIRKDIYESYEKDNRLKEKAFITQYINDNPLYTKKEFKKDRFQYMRNIRLENSLLMKRELEEFDNKILVPGELERHGLNFVINKECSLVDDTLDEIQMKFVKKCIETDKNIALFGGAGTGKSTCIAKLLEVIPSKYKVLCCSYTGCAINRVKKIVNRNYENVDIKTIHKAAKARYKEYYEFTNNENNLLNYDICIVDEISMVDTFLFYCLINALPKNTKIIVVGDFNQLEPVKNFSLEPLITPKYFEIIRLEKNYRCDNEINKLAYKFLDKYESDLLEKYDQNKVINLINEGYSLISNTNKICNTINKIVTSNYQIKIGDYNYTIDQEIVFLRNDPKIDVYNGMRARITSYDSERELLTINYKIVIDIYDAIDLIKPTYAMTIHKMQGSEIEKVIVVIDNNENLINFKMIYTAITRAKKEIILMKINGVDEKKLYKLCK